MRLLITAEARHDLIEIGEWIAQHNPKRAVSFVEELQSSCAEILNYPEKYPLVARYETRGLRRKVHGNYLIFYRSRPNQVEIIHILHGAKDSSDLL